MVPLLLFLLWKAGWQFVSIGGLLSGKAGRKGLAVGWEAWGERSVVVLGRETRRKGLIVGRETGRQ